MIDVILISCPMVLSKTEPFHLQGDETSSPWVGLLYLAAYLKKNNISVKIYNPAIERLSLKDITKRLTKDKPRVVGLSALTTGLRSAVKLAKAIRKLDQKIVIGLGGSHVNADPNFILRNPFFNFSVAGDGEITFTKIVQLIKKGKRLKQKVFHGKIITDLDKIPFPARHLINITQYHAREKEGLKEKPWLSILGSRGCPYHCIFCSRHPSWRKARFRSAKNIVDEMKLYFSYCDGKFSFLDDTITANRKLILLLCDEIIKRRLKVRWTGITRANWVDEEMIKKMKQTGCEALFFGVESGNERFRNEVVKKQLTNKEIAKAFQLCRKYKIQIHTFLMLGFPGETKDIMEDTINFALRFRPDFIGVHPTLILPGTEIFNQAQNEKKIPHNFFDLYAQDKLPKDIHNNWPLYIPDGMTKKTIMQARRKTYLKFYLSPWWIWHRLRLWFQDNNILREDLSMIKTGIHVLIHGKTKNAVV